MIEEYQEFLSNIQKRGSKEHHISHCYGVRDAWKWVRKNKWVSLNNLKCSSSLYAEVVNTTNKILAEMLLEGHEIVLPYQLGSLRIIGVPAQLKMRNGVLRNNYRVDWKKTLDYWYQDSQAKDEKRLIKRIQKNLYSIHYNKSRASYRNQRYYMFRANRGLVRQFGNRIRQGKLNTLNY